VKFSFQKLDINTSQGIAAKCLAYDEILVSLCQYLMGVLKLRNLVAFFFTTQYIKFYDGKFKKNYKEI